jgi:hypothetical protein
MQKAWLSFRSIGFRKRRQIFWKDDFAGLCPFFNLIADQVRPLRRKQGADFDVFAKIDTFEKGLAFARAQHIGRQSNTRLVQRDRTSSLLETARVRLRGMT